MVRGFRYKDVERFLETGSKAGIQAAHPHALLGNWRLTFAFEIGDAVLVDYQDCH